MKKTIIFAMLIAIMIVASPVSAQTIVKGNVVNERGEGIEYVSIGFENDSVGVISDAKAHHVLQEYQRPAGLPRLHDEESHLPLLQGRTAVPLRLRTELYYF